MRFSLPEALSGHHPGGNVCGDSHLGIDHRAMCRLAYDRTMPLRHRSPGVGLRGLLLKA